MCFSKEQRLQQPSSTDPSLHLAHIKTALRSEQLDTSRPALDAQLAGLLSQSFCRGSCSDAWYVRRAHSSPSMYIKMGTVASTWPTTYQP